MAPLPTLRLIAIFSSLLLVTQVAWAQSVFAPGERFTEEVVFRGLPVSTAVAFAPGERVYLAVKTGLVMVAVSGAVRTQPFLDISAEVNKSTDRGLLGIAVDPDFPEKPYIYLAYVYDPPGSTPDSQDPRVVRVVRVRADSSKGYNEAVPGSMEVILGKNSRAEFMAPPVPAGDPNTPERSSCMTGLTMAGEAVPDCIPCDALSHTAGTLQFGPNRTLIASFGDGSDYDRPSTLSFRSQDLDSMAGRVVRVDPDTGVGVPGNPYYDAERPDSNRSKVWSLGFRNPFRVTLNQANGQIYAGDVGTSYYEEINVGKGALFGWPCYEGGFLNRATLEGMADESIPQVGFKQAPETIYACNALYARGQGAVTKPLFTYRHPYDSTGKDLGSSITGIAFYEGSSYPASYRGALFYADYAQRFIRYLTFDSFGRPTRHDFAQESSPLGAVQLITGPDTNIYAVYIDLKTRTSEIRRFKYLEGQNTPPTVRLKALPAAGDIPLTVSFSSTGTYDADGQALSYTWDFGDGSVRSTEENPTHVYTRVGAFAATLTVTEKTAPFTESSEEIMVRTGVSPPVAIIDYPLPGVRYQIGRPITFSGHATVSAGDAPSLTWLVLQRHNQHEHLVTEISGASGSFVPEEHSDNTSYELCLSASAGEGLVDNRCLPILPETAQYKVSSIPGGAIITYIDDERELIAPALFGPIVGSEQTIVASGVHAGRSFERWSDGLRSPARTFVVDSQPRTFQAIYVNRPPKAVARAQRLNKRGSFRFDASASSDPEGEPLRYVWSFPDGSSRAAARLSKRFARPGVYRVVLTVRDRLGTVGTRVLRVVVPAAPKAG